MQLRKMKPAGIQVSATYQRAVSKAAARRIVREFDADAFGVLFVGERDDGTFWCVDGQTRLQAALELELETVPCLVFYSEGAKHEAKMFRLINTARRVSLADKIRAQYNEGDEATIDMIDRLSSCGVSVTYTNQKQWPYTKAFSTLLAAYEGGVLEKVFNTIVAVWGPTQDPHGLQNTIVAGLTRFYIKYGDVIDDKRLRQKLSNYTCIALIAKADATQLGGSSRAVEMCNVIRDAYNYRCTAKNRIE